MRVYRDYTSLAERIMELAPVQSHDMGLAWAVLQEARHAMAGQSWAIGQWRHPTVWRWYLRELEDNDELRNAADAVVRFAPACMTDGLVKASLPLRQWLEVACPVLAQLREEHGL